MHTLERLALFSQECQSLGGPLVLRCRSDQSLQKVLGSGLFEELLSNAIRDASAGWIRSAHDLDALSQALITLVCRIGGGACTFLLQSILFHRGIDWERNGSLLLGNRVQRGTKLVDIYISRQNPPRSFPGLARRKLAPLTHPPKDLLGYRGTSLRVPSQTRLQRHIEPQRAPPDRRRRGLLLTDLIDLFAHGSKVKVVIQDYHGPSVSLGQSRLESVQCNRSTLLPGFEIISDVGLNPIVLDPETTVVLGQLSSQSTLPGSGKTTQEDHERHAVFWFFMILTVMVVAPKCVRPRQDSI